MRKILCSALLLSAWFAQASALPPSRLEQAARDYGADAGSYQVDEMVMAPMRDGVRLSTTVIRPTADGGHPVVLIRTPYDMVGELSKRFFRTLFANGYAVVMQNERGTHWSEGAFGFLNHAREDGYDTLTWIARQRWSNGRVGTYGCSSAGENQLGLGTLQHPAHKAMIAMSAGSGVGGIPGVSSQGLFYKGGAPTFAPWVLWYASYGHSARPALPAGLSVDELRRFALTYDPEKGRLEGAEFDARVMASIQALPSRDVLRRIGLPRTDFETFIARTPADPAWENLGLITQNDTGAIPALHVNAWGDVGPYETVKLFEFQQRHPEQYLIMAPTAHCDMMKATENTVTGDRAMGDARLPYEQIYLQWFDQHLKGQVDAVAPMPKVRTFLMGANRWLTGERWPLPGVSAQRFYLHSEGRANSRFGDGRLSRDAPLAAQQFDRFTSDPATPAPSEGGGCCDRRVFKDQSAVESRQDVLVYSTSALQTGVSVVGDVNAVIFVSSTTPDADVAVKLVDVYPDGRAFNLADTILRLRYRGGFDKPKPLVPGQVYRVEIKGMVTSNHFGAGHRLRIEIAGANFPNHERNLHTGGHNYDETELRVAVTSIHHTPKYASYIELPVYSGKTTAAAR